MIKVKPIEFQPGTGTRYDVVIGQITTRKDADVLCCKVGDVFLAWKGQGAYNFSPGVQVDYMMSKMKIHYEIDAEALIQLVRWAANTEIHPDWGLCKACGLPYHKRGASRKNCCMKV